MRVFVAGASGSIGTRLVPALIAREYEVIGRARSPAHAERVRALGGEPIPLDLARTLRGRLRADDPDRRPRSLSRPRHARAEAASELREQSRVSQLPPSSKLPRDRHAASATRTPTDPAQRDVAADLGLSRQTVSRVLGQLARHELIESRRGELLVRDYGELERIRNPARAGVTARATADGKSDR